MHHPSTTVLAGILLCTATTARAPAQAQLPPGFVEEHVLDVGPAPASMKFAPDGRLFVGRRVTGELLVATRDGRGGWQLDPSPYAVLDVPKDGGGKPAAHRSSGLRDFAFDPGFSGNGLLYVFYMKDSPRHNRVVRLRQDPSDPSRALPGSETLLLDLPFNGSASSGSHNGGAVEIGADGKLYVTTGDGWSGGDPVQSLGTYTGKVFRIATDGSIPTDNPFYGRASGPLRAIWSLGCRNPFSMSLDPLRGELYLNETTGPNKTEVFRVARGANYGHQGQSGIGTPKAPWVAAGAGGKLNTGGAFYAGSFPWPTQLPFPGSMHGSYFVAQWGSNSSPSGDIARVPAGGGAPVAFATGVRALDSDGKTWLKPVTTRVGPDGHLYYLLTSYQARQGRVHRIRYTGGGGTVATPTITPPGGRFPGPVQVTLATKTPGAVVHYTLDGTDPTASSPRYGGPIRVASSTTLKARAYLSGRAPSAVAAGVFTIGGAPNVPPVALAGPDLHWPLGRLATLNGSASYDPDGPAALLTEQWVQVAGPRVRNFDGSDFVSFFRPEQVGRYTFRLDVSDGEDTSSDQVTITVVRCLDEVLGGMLARWLADEGRGGRLLDGSTGAADGWLRNGVRWTTETAYPRSRAALRFDGVDDVVMLSPDVEPSGAALTLSAWFQADDFDVPDARILSKASGSGEDEHDVMVSTVAVGGSHRLRFRLRTDGVTSTLTAASGDLVAGAWTHVVARYDGRAMELWRDGVLVGTMPKTGRVTSDPRVRAAIGNQPIGAGGGRPFDGVIDDVRLYGRALGAGEIRRLGRGTLGSIPAACGCALNLGAQGPGDAVLSLCGEPGGKQLAIRLVNGTPGGPAMLVFGGGQQPLWAAGGLLVPQPVRHTLFFLADAEGSKSWTALPRPPFPAAVLVQAVGLDASLPQGIWFSNALAVVLPM